MDGFNRCLKKNLRQKRSGSGNIKIPTCRFFKELEFLKNRVKNKPTTSHANIAKNNGSGLDDVPSPPHTPGPSTSSILTQGWVIRQINKN